MKVVILRILASPDSYFFDIFDAVLAGWIRQAGHETHVLERILSPDLERGEQIDGAVRRLAELGPDLVLLSYSFDPRIPRRIKEEVGAVVGVFGSVWALKNPAVDLVIGEPDPRVCLAVIGALEAGERPDDLVPVAGLATRSNPVPVLGTWTPSVPEIFIGAPLAYDAFLRLGPGRPTEQRKHVVGNLGCPFRGARPRQPLEPAPPAPVPATGCHFCSRSAYESVPEDVLSFALEMQLDQVLAAFPNPAKLILIDEAGLSYVDAFARLVAARPMEETALLLSGRVDHPVRFQGPLREACRILEGAAPIHLYQIGLESFSQTALDRFGKGLTPKEMEQALAGLRQLVDELPNLVIEPSFGFICFDPWTTVEELRANAEAARRLNLDQLRGRAWQTRLRLYPEVPLFWRARAEGLLIEEEAVDDFGYQAGAPWRFKHPEVEEIWRELRSRGGWQRLAELVGGA